MPGSIRPPLYGGAPGLHMTAMPAPAISFDNSYARDLPGFYANCRPTPVAAPRLVLFNEPLAADLGLAAALADRDLAARLLGGVEVPEGATPIAQAYAGHQFGGFSPQLGDGRAVLLGEVIARDGARRDIQLKGSGPTPFARRGDGRAALGPMLREYLVSEAMSALDVPTTRALAVVATGEAVHRDRPLPGAVLTRVAASHIRIGTFQFFAARGELDRLRQLADYAMARHYPGLAAGDNPYAAFLAVVASRQAELVARWMLVGFVHGVMNTDNVAVSGETIDYGPCAFLDDYDPRTVYSSIDERGRYAYGNQPALMAWNLARFAEALLPLLDADEAQAVERANTILGGFAEAFERTWLDGLGRKIGLIERRGDDRVLIEGLLAAMQQAGADFTLTFRALSALLRGEEDALAEAADDLTPLGDWLPGWQARLAEQGLSPPAVARTMDAVNPIVIPRNHLVEAALQAAESGGLALFHRLHEALKSPFTADSEASALSARPPRDLPRYRTFCGT